MMTMQLIEHILLPDDMRVIQIAVAKEGVQVTLDDYHRPGYDKNVVALQWDEISDVEFISQRFEYEAVRTFKKLCEMLGTIHTNQHIYQSLL